MSTQGIKMKYTSTNHSSTVLSDRWEHSSFATLEKDPQVDPCSPAKSKKTANADSLNEKWVFEKTQEDPLPTNTHVKKNRRPDRALYKHPYKQEKQISKIDEMEDKSYVNTTVDKEPTQPINDDVISNASTNFSSDKRSLSSEDKAEDLSMVRNGSDVQSVDTPLEFKDADTPFFELSLTFSEEVTAQLTIYENQQDVIKLLEELCKPDVVPEETALHIKIFVLKQLQDTKFPDFDKYQDYYKDLLEQNFALLISTRENEEAISNYGNEWTPNP